MKSWRAAATALVLFVVSLEPACKSPSAGVAGQGVDAALAATPAPATSPSLYDLTVRRLDGTPAPLAAYRGKVVLVVNVASECGYTPQYAGLESLHEELAPRGFAVLGFPSNDFGEQEPGTPEQIAAFAASTYHVTFPLFEKVKTAGDGVSPVYGLVSQIGGPPKWNFHKYLVDKEGRVVRAFPSAVAPDSPELRDAIRATLDPT